MIPNLPVNSKYSYEKKQADHTFTAQSKKKVFLRLIIVHYGNLPMFIYKNKVLGVRCYLYIKIT